MNEIEKKAEQLFDDIRMLKGQYNVRLAAGLNDRAKSMKDLAIDLILQFAREIAEGQRDVCLTSYKNRNLEEPTDYYSIKNAPLLTNKTK